MHNNSVYVSKLPVSALTNDLNALAELDKESERRISYWGNFRIVLFFIGAILILGVAFLEELSLALRHYRIFAS